ncbi:MAG: AbrB/MazE/SpoVT family DNA-binding domain-containing protein [Bryobacteraceae bacterium]
MADAQIAKWGNSLAVRLPRGIVRDAGLVEGDRVLLDVTEDGAILLRAGRPKYSLDELVSGITPKNRHREADWGKAVGKEVW